jgi:hypothetical protein
MSNIDKHHGLGSMTLEADVVTFYATGDVPYGHNEYDIFSTQISKIPKNTSFFIHLGDISKKEKICVEDMYKKISDMLKKSHVPVFILPGDNEWNDCDNTDLAWKYWSKYFMKFEKHWVKFTEVNRQVGHEENFSFIKNGVLFIGLNIVGGRVHDIFEWKTRHKKGLEWIRNNINNFKSNINSIVVLSHAGPRNPAVPINYNGIYDRVKRALFPWKYDYKMHKSFLDDFDKIAQDFNKPILYIHANGHKWLYDRPFDAQNILRVQVNMGGKEFPIKVTVTKDKKHPFVFNRVIY